MGTSAARRFACGFKLKGISRLPSPVDRQLSGIVVRENGLFRSGLVDNWRADFSELWDYTRTLYQIPGIAETVHLDQIKMHYYGSHR
jgi:glutathionyl-hydroquinone reductase